jgi:hypothetical protein
MDPSSTLAHRQTLPRSARAPAVWLPGLVAALMLVTSALFLLVAFLAG